MLQVVPNKYLIIKGKVPYTTKTGKKPEIPDKFKLRCGPIRVGVRDNESYIFQSLGIDSEFKMESFELDDYGNYEIKFKIPEWANKSTIEGDPIYAKPPEFYTRPKTATVYTPLKATPPPYPYIVSLNRYMTKEEVQLGLTPAEIVRAIKQK